VNGPPHVRDGQVVVDGPHRHRSEQRWRLRLPDGAPAVVARLLPELADDPALRRRFVYEAERLRDLGAASVAPILAIGPGPDPRDPGAEPPWRLRADPAGTGLDHLLGRAPLAIDEALDLVARIGDAMHAVHAVGGVLRDLEPRAVIVGDDGRVWMTDVGLARLDILSTRTASSLMLETSPYAAPEHLRATVVDPRADVYTLGVILWKALTGVLPHDDQPAFLRTAEHLPGLGEVRAGVDDRVAELARRCLALEPERRPESAREVAAVLRGEQDLGGVALERVACQACGEPMRAGLRLCLACGREAVQFHHLDADHPDTWAIELPKAKDEAAFLAALREFYDETADAVPALDFLTGDARWYSKKERERLHTLPARLYDDLDEAGARALAARLGERGIKTNLRSARKIRRGRRVATGIAVSGGAAGAGGIALLAGGTIGAGVLMLVGGVVVGLVATIIAASGRKAKLPLTRLRAAPLALPASDPYVARLSEVLAENPAPDLRERLGELALLVQRLCDRRAARAGDPELALVTEPLDPLTELACRTARAVIALDRDLADLDEGALVRALAASEARGEPAGRREPLLSALDRLRALEDRRAAHLQRLLEATSLLRRTADLAAAGSDADHDTQVAMAMTALQREL
jgi:hypothetical protein